MTVLSSRVVRNHLGADLIEARNVLAHEVKDVGSVAALRPRAFDVPFPPKPITQGPPHATIDKAALDAKHHVAEERHATGRPHMMAKPSRGCGVRLDEPRQRGAALPRIEVVRPTWDVADDGFGRELIGLLAHRVGQLARQQRNDRAQQFACAAIAPARDRYNTVRPACLAQLRLATGTCVLQGAGTAAKRAPKRHCAFTTLATGQGVAA